MKIVNILGGLGNQMFEYAMYLALREAHPAEEVTVCTRSFHGYPLHNGYELSRIFGIQPQEASLAQLARLAYPFWNYRTWQVMRHWLPKRNSMTRGASNFPFDEKEITRKDSAYYDGYWQNEGNFLSIRDKVLYAYNFPNFLDSKNKELAKKIQSLNSVSCHVRRGDYLKHSNMCVCTHDYYKRAIEKVKHLVTPDLYCVFSDDIEWCRENIGPLCQDKEVVYVDWNKGEDSFRDMQLMSLCKHNIIANSSFSWWGAWLNRNDMKVVITPEKWMNEDIVNDPICDSWVRIKS